MPKRKKPRPESSIRVVIEVTVDDLTITSRNVAPKDIASVLKEALEDLKDQQ